MENGLSIPKLFKYGVVTLAAITLAKIIIFSDANAQPQLLSEVSGCYYSHVSKNQLHFRILDSGFLRVAGRDVAVLVKQTENEVYIATGGDGGFHVDKGANTQSFKFLNHDFGYSVSPNLDQIMVPTTEGSSVLFYKDRCD